MHFTSVVIIWSVLAIVVLALALMRYLGALHEDDNLHLGPDARAQIKNQVLFYRHLDKIDKWGKILTVVALATGLVLAAIFVYRTMP